jgi:hypothetical protein
MPTEILYEHAAPLGVIIVAVALALALGVFFFRRFLPGEKAAFFLWPIRAFFFLVLGWCLLVPTQKLAITEVLRPRFLVALDTSRSMSLAANTNLPARWQQAQALLRQPWLAAVEKQCDVEIFPFAQELGQRVTALEATALAPTGTATLIRETLRALAERYRGQPLGGLLLLSDGLDTREARDDWTATSWPCPVYSARLEPAAAWKVEPDVRVDLLDTPRRVVVGWDSELKAVIEGISTANQPVRVQLFENDVLLEEIPTQLPAEGGRREVKFTLRHPVIGNFTYAVRIPPLRGETHTNDNAQRITTQVIDAQNRLLYLEDVPRWESKFLNRLLNENQTVSALTFIRSGKRWLTFGREQASATDWTQLPLATYKIIMLGDLEAPMLAPAQLEELTRYVEAGGSLVLLGGARAWGANGFEAGPLKKILPISRAGHRPVLEGTFPATVTPEGLAHPAFRRKEEGAFSMPPVLSVYPGSRPGAGAQVLVTAKTDEGTLPLVIEQRYGQGRVVAILSDSLWRWSMDPTQSKSYARFWNQLIQALVPEQRELERFALELQANTDHPYLGDTLQFSARLAARGGEPTGAAAVTCEITTPAGRKLPFTMQAQPLTTGPGGPRTGFVTELRAEEPGLYQAMARMDVAGLTVESPPYPVYVRPYTPETMPKPANVAALQALARASGGRFCEFNDLNDTLARLPFTQQEEQRVIYRSLWNHWAWLATLIALLMVEWSLRRWRNLA